jgi:hypothetical protein
MADVPPRDHAMIRRYCRHQISVGEALNRGWLPSTRFDVAVQRPHDADPREHRRAPGRRDEHQRS